MFEPASGTLTFEEGVGTAGTTVMWADPSATLEIEEVTLEVINTDPNSSPLGEPLTGFTLTWSGDSFTFGGTFSTWFSRTTTFVKEEGIVEGKMTYSFNNQVSKPADLPPSFFAAYKIESPPGSLTLVFTITGVLTASVPPVEEGEEGGESGGGEEGPSGPVELEWECEVQSNYNSNIAGVRYAVEQGSAFKRYEEI